MSKSLPRAGIWLACALLGSFGCGPSASSSTSSQWLQLSSLFSSRHRPGVFLATVRSVDVVTERQAIPGTLNVGFYVRATIDVTLAGQPFVDADPHYNGDYEETWDVGSDVSVVSADYAHPCIGLERVLAAGDRIVLFPTTSTSLRAKGRDGRRVPYGSPYAHFICVDSSDMVHFEDHTDGGGVDEVFDISLPQFTAALAKLWGQERETAKSRVRDDCVSVQCPEASTCFFGEGCVVVRHVAPPGQLENSDFPPDARGP